MNVSTPLFHSQLAQVFLDIEGDLGTTELVVLTLESFHHLLENVSFQTSAEVIKEFDTFLDNLKNTNPRIGMMIHYFLQLRQTLETREFATVSDLKDFLQAGIDDALKTIRGNVTRLIDRGAGVIQDGDKILTFSNSHVIMSIFARAKEQHVSFEVVLAEQDDDRTHDMIRFLQSKDIPFVVAPEFMLQHVCQDVTQCFLSSLTLNREKHFVCGTGTNSIISQISEFQIPVSMFILTDKFSLWATSSLNDHSITSCQLREVRHNGVRPYHRVKFSHDRLPLNACSKIVTEDGVYTADQITEVYDAMYNERKEWRIRHFSE